MPTPSKTLAEQLRRANRFVIVPLYAVAGLAVIQVSARLLERGHVKAALEVGGTLVFFVLLVGLLVRDAMRGGAYATEFDLRSGCQTATAAPTSGSPCASV